MRISLNQLNIRKTAEKILFGWAFLIVLCHLFFAVFQYVIPFRMVGEYEAYRKWLLWGALFFFLAVAAYFVFSLLLTADSRTRALSALKKTFTFEQTVLLVIFLWYLLSIYLNGRRAGYPEIYFKALDWNIFDTFLCMLVLFPLPRLLGKDQTKQFIEFLIHFIVITYSVFTTYCLWHIFHGEAVDLPSGYQAFMGEDTQLVLSMNANTTGGITATMFCLCVYMIVTQTWLIKIPYCIFGFFQLIALYLTNSRTPFLAAAIFLVFVVFWLTWKAAGKKPVLLRILISFLAAAVVFFVFWKARTLAFVAFEKIAKYPHATASNLTATGKNYTPALLAASRNAQASAMPIVAARGEGGTRLINGLSGREGVWNTCIRIMTSSRFNFFFGITPGDTANQITSVGRFDKVIAHAHNDILQVGLTAGVPMMAAYFVLLLQIIIRCIRCLIHQKTKQTVVLTGILLFFLLNGMAEAYIFAVFSVINCLFFLFSGWITELDDEMPILAPAKKRIILKGTVSTLACAACIIALLLYADRYINLNPNRIPGSGTRLDPYLIEDKDDLCYFRDLVNHGANFENQYFLQTSNIDLQGIKWKPIGNWISDYDFCGIYDGGCKEINNINVTYDGTNWKKGRNGFFGYLKGTVKNLGIESGVIEGEYAAGIVSRSEGGTILNCYNKATVRGTSRAAGICDVLSDGTVLNCLNEGILEAPTTASLITYDAKLILGQEQENNVASYFTGTFVPISLSGETVQEKLNSGLKELINMKILQQEAACFW